MSGFTRAWLALREPFDRRSRSEALARAFAAALSADARVVDLGAGAGANMRYLAPLVRPSVQWRLVDSDASLLAAAGDLLPRDRSVETMQIDLSRDLAAALDGADAVTASALMDLVSANWLDTLSEIAARRRLPLLFALSADGKRTFAPADEADPMVLAAFRSHQLGDKGFGSALGPEAPSRMKSRLEALGAEVRIAASDWRIGRDAPSMLAAMIDGIAAAAGEVAPDRIDDIAAWRRRRHDARARASLSMVVGHKDVVALWRARRVGGKSSC